MLRENVMQQKNVQVADCERKTQVRDHKAQVCIQQFAMRQRIAELTIARLNADQVQVYS